VRLPVAAALVVALGGCLAVRLVPASPFALVVVGIAMGLGYLALVWLAEGKRLRADVGNLVRISRPAAGN
jgi:hypothetical protein